MANPEVDIDALSEQQQLALQQYTAVTDQDVQAAIPLLQKSQWNVQIAITKFFDGEGPDPVAEAIAAQNVPPPRAGRQENLQESLIFGTGSTTRGERQPIPAPRIVPQPDSEVIRRPNFILALLFAPFNLLYKILSTSFGFFSYLFPFLPRALRPNSSSGPVRRANTGGRRALKPRDSAARLKREFEEEYGSNTLPFFEGGYAQALDLAKKDLKFLLILLLSPEHDDTSSFIRDTLLSSSVQAYLSDPANNIVLWVGDVRDSEAYQVSTAVNCTKFPYTAVVAHTPSVSSTSMSVISHITGPMESATYLGKIRVAITKHEETLATVRATRNAQNFERSLRQEQDSAYERSLAADRERARVKREAEKRAAEEERRRKEEEEAAALLAERKTQWRKWRASKINPEPSTSEKDVVRIAVKMPEHLGAERVMRRFRATDSMEELYAFVECYGEDGEDVEKPDGYEHLYGFRLVQTLPRVVFGVQEGTIGNVVGRSGNLIVEQINGEDDDAEVED